MIAVCDDRVNDRLVRVKLACIVLFPAEQSARKKPAVLAPKYKLLRCYVAEINCFSRTFPTMHSRSHTGISIKF